MKSQNFEPLGVSPEDLGQISEILVKGLSHKTSYKIFVFGSRSQGTQSTYSDCDLWIDSTPPLSPSELSTLSEALEDSNVTIKIDLVTPQTIYEPYRASIEKSLNLWLQKN